MVVLRFLVPNDFIRSLVLNDFRRVAVYDVSSRENTFSPKSFRKIGFKSYGLSCLKQVSMFSFNNIVLLRFVRTFCF